MRTFMLLLLSTSCAFGQVDSGAIAGVITDATGAIVPSVKVDVIQAETNTTTSLTTNSAGFWPHRCGQAFTWSA